MKRNVNFKNRVIIGFDVENIGMDKKGNLVDTTHKIMSANDTHGLKSVVVFNSLYVLVYTDDKLIEHKPIDLPTTTVHISQFDEWPTTINTDRMESKFLSILRYYSRKYPEHKRYLSAFNLSHDASQYKFLSNNSGFNKLTGNLATNESNLTMIHNSIAFGRLRVWGKSKPAVWQLRDPGRVFPGKSLDQLAGSLLGEHKVDFEMTAKNLLTTEKVKPYNNRDSRLTAELTNLILTNYGDQLTASSMALKGWLNFMQEKNEWSDETMDAYKETHLFMRNDGTKSQNVKYNLFRQAYLGGLTGSPACNFADFKSAKEFNNIIEFDYTQMYPSMIQKSQYPNPNSYHLKKFTNKKYLINFINNHKEAFLFGYLDLKYFHFPKDKFSNFLRPSRYGNTKVFTSLEQTNADGQALINSDLRYFINNADFNINSAYVYIFDTIPEEVTHIREFVRNNQIKRKATTDPVRKFEYKLENNSLSGKFGQHVTESAKFSLKRSAPETVPISLDKLQYFNVLFISEITARARITLLNLINEVGRENVAQVDTDSGKFTITNKKSFEQIQSIIKQINAKADPESGLGGVHLGKIAKKIKILNRKMHCRLLIKDGNIDTYKDFQKSLQSKNYDFISSHAGMGNDIIDMLGKTPVEKYNNFNFGMTYVGRVRYKTETGFLVLNKIKTVAPTGVKFKDLTQKEKDLLYKKRVFNRYMNNQNNDQLM